MLKSEMLDYVKKTFPDIIINQVHENHNGWDNDILIINHDIVFRFPKSERLISKLKSEAKLLEYLQQKQPIVNTPHHELIYDSHQLKCVKYNFIEGITLNEEEIKELGKNTENARLLGDFLAKLHSIPASDLEKTNVSTIHTQQYWENLYSSVKSSVFPFLSSPQRVEINEVFTNFLGFFSDLVFEKCIIHGDLSVSNIIFHQGIVNGIIDFTDAQIGDPAFDFAGVIGHLDLILREKFCHFIMALNQRMAYFRELVHFMDYSQCFTSYFTTSRKTINLFLTHICVDSLSFIHLVRLKPAFTHLLCS